MYGYRFYNMDLVPKDNGEILKVRRLVQVTVPSLTPKTDAELKVLADANGGVEVLEATDL